MKERFDVQPVSGLVGRPVLSLSTGNKLGTVSDVFIDALSGLIVGFSASTVDGSTAAISFDAVHSFGGDAIMATSDSSMTSADEKTFAGYPTFRDLTGTKIITESGQLLGHIAGLYVTGSLEPVVFYEVRESLFDALLGRHRFIYASAGHALSDDKERLIVPDEAAEAASPTIDELLGARTHVRSFSPVESRHGGEPDDTVVIVPAEIEDETVVRTRDDDETVIRFRSKH